MGSSDLHDVLVVGAGPAGLYTALRTAEAGLDTVVLEEHAEIGIPTHCTGIVSGETNRLYKVRDEVVLHRPSSCLMISPGGRVAELEDPGEEIAVLDRAAFDQALAASVLEAGGVVRTSARVDHAHKGDRFVEKLFGLELSQKQYDRGEAFVRGVVERAGRDGLARLWTSTRELPTPNEVDAPGLWWERINLPDPD